MMSFIFIFFAIRILGTERAGPGHEMCMVMRYFTIHNIFLTENRDLNVFSTTTREI